MVKHLNRDTDLQSFISKTFSWDLKDCARIPLHSCYWDTVSSHYNEKNGKIKKKTQKIPSLKDMRILLDEKAITKTIMCLRWHAVLCTGVKLLDLENGGQSLFSVHDVKIEHNSVILTSSLERIWLKFFFFVGTKAKTSLQQTQEIIHSGKVERK